jgi:hypothetical protein
MPSMKRLLQAFLLAALAGGCQSGWVRSDGAAADATRLERARKVCRVERKLAALERTREERDRELRQSNSNQVTMQVKEDFAAVERQVQEEIEACMRQQGFARKG